MHPIKRVCVWQLHTLQRSRQAIDNSNLWGHILLCGHILFFLWCQEDTGVAWAGVTAERGMQRPVPAQCEQPHALLPMCLVSLFSHSTVYLRELILTPSLTLTRLSTKR